MPATSDISTTRVDRIVYGLIRLWRIVVGMIAAMILAPMLTGLLLGLTRWPTSGFGEYVREIAGGTLIIVFFGIVVSFKAVIFVVLPGIILLRWFGVMSRTICVIGGSIACAYPLTGFVGIVASPLPLDWRLIGVGLFSGAVAGWIYWRVAERPLPDSTPSSQPG